MPSRSTQPTILALALFALIVAAALSAEARQGPGTLAETSGKLTVTTALAQSAVLSGSSTKAAVIMAIDGGWHVNAHIPSESYLIGTSASLEPREGFILADLRYPDGELVAFEFSEKPLDVYEGTVTIFMTIRVAESVEPGDYVLKGTLEAQACNDQVCLAPSSVEFLIPVTVTRSADEVRAVNDEIFSTYDEATLAAPAPGTSEFARIFEAEGSLAAFLAIFLVGLALNLTPCVYPMLSVTVSLFGTQTETRTLRVFFKALGAPQAGAGQAPRIVSMSLHAEIFEQPASLERLLRTQRPMVEAIAREIHRRDICYAFLAARGTSDNAGRYANYLWGARNGLPLALAAPSLFTYYQQPPHLNNALVVGVSQSGQSPDIVGVLEEGRRQGCLTLAITNEANSPLAQVADLVLDIQAGVEQAVAATKTYTAELFLNTPLAQLVKSACPTHKRRIV